MVRGDGHTAAGTDRALNSVVLGNGSPYVRGRAKQRANSAGCLPLDCHVANAPMPAAGLLGGLKKDTMSTSGVEKWSAILPFAVLDRRFDS
jgi:hypothetical protein